MFHEKIDFLLKKIFLFYDIHLNKKYYTIFSQTIFVFKGRKKGGFYLWY